MIAFKVLRSIWQVLSSFIHKVLHAFEVKNNISSIKIIILSDIFNLSQLSHDVLFTDLSFLELKNSF